MRFHESDIISTYDKIITMAMVLDSCARGFCCKAQVFAQMNCHYVPYLSLLDQPMAVRCPTSKHNDKHVTRKGQSYQRAHTQMSTHVTSTWTLFRTIGLGSPALICLVGRPQKTVRYNCHCIDLIIPKEIMAVMAYEAPTRLWMYLSE